MVPATLGARDTVEGVLGGGCPKQQLGVEGIPRPLILQKGACGPQMWSRSGCPHLWTGCIQRPPRPQTHHRAVLCGSPDQPRPDRHSHGATSTVLGHRRYCQLPRRHSQSSLNAKRRPGALLNPVLPRDQQRPSWSHCPLLSSRTKPRVQAPGGPAQSGPCASQCPLCPTGRQGPCSQVAGVPVLGSAPSWGVSGQQIRADERPPPELSGRPTTLGRVTAAAATALPRSVSVPPSLPSQPLRGLPLRPE